MTYQAFLASKARRWQGEGFQSDQSLFPQHRFAPYQRAIVQWACAKGRAAIFADTGLGKTVMQLVWANQVHGHTNGRVLILAPLAVSWQTCGEAQRYGMRAKVVQDQSECDAPICITNYEKLHRFDPASFHGVVLDECFPPGTLIDTPSGSCYIETLRQGDLIVNASGVDVIADVHRREIQYAVAFTAGGKRITASPNHPVFTQRGWVASQDLEPGDAILQTTAAMRMVRDGVSPASVSVFRAIEILREILLSEMADEPAGAYCENPYAGNCGETRGQASGMAQDSCGQSGDRTYSRTQSDEQSRSQRESVPHIETHEARSFRAWRKRERHDGTTEDYAGCARQWMGSRIECLVGETESWLSHALQAGLSQLRDQGRYRSGWQLPSFSQSAGCQEVGNTEFVGVDRLEILEPGHPELERLRDADGKLYFYDLGATQHPSYSVNSFLVHNSSILKSFQGRMKNRLIDAFRNTPYRLACTATPSPNDHLELGNHSDFLGIMPQKEMLARWFVNDLMGNMSWRLKGHAKTDFWRWVSSWAVSLRTPSDLGFEDDGYALPDLKIAHVPVETTGMTVGGALFADASLSATNLHEVMRQTAPFRARRAAELLRAEPDEQWLVWTHTNYEADEMRALGLGLTEVRGGDSDKHKEETLIGFANGEVRRLLTKSSIAGFGMNWQGCARMVFVGMNHSYESFYQAVRRCWRFGQTRDVVVSVLATDHEFNLLDVIAKKQRDHRSMQDEMIALAKEEFANG